jgi:hypothetical protein
MGVGTIDGDGRAIERIGDRHPPPGTVSSGLIAEILTDYRFPNPYGFVL